MDGPFREPAQPIASVAVERLTPGETVVIGADAASFPAGLDDLHGPVRVQVVLDADETERSFLEGPGNVVSAVVSVELRRDATDTVTLDLDRPIVTRASYGARNLVWVRLRSELLSAFYGRDVFHRAGVALPPAYLEEDADADPWPVVYVIPDFGRRDAMTRTYAVMLATPGIDDIAPMAVHVVLDPESPLGHHGFVDSPSNGPRETALLTELIPHLEHEFRLAARPAGRILTGHSSGGWTSLWLQLTRPDVFGACWATAPDPVDHHAYQMHDLYDDANLYRDDAGVERGTLRRIVSVEGDMAVVMTARQECGMEDAIDPTGGSGQQWHAWEAMYSPRQPGRGPVGTHRPRPLFDRRTGEIDHAVAEHWRRFDLARLVTSDWDRYGPVLMERVRLSCGELDNFYLDRAVRRFKTQVERLAAEHGGWRGSGYIELVPDATHYTLTASIFQNVNREMRQYLSENGFKH